MQKNYKFKIYDEKDTILGLGISTMYNKYYKFEDWYTLIEQSYSDKEVGIMTPRSTNICDPVCEKGSYIIAFPSIQVW